MMPLTAKRIEHLACQLAGRTDQDVTHAIRVYDVETKIAIRHAIAMQQEAQGIQARAAAVPGRRLGEQDGSYWLRRLGVTGPITQKQLEDKMTAAALEPHIRVECKLECMERRWLSQGLGYRLSAAGLATDQVRDDRLASDHSVIDYGPPPLSLEMFGLFNRAGLQENRTYAPHEVDELLRNSDLTTLQKIACRQELAMRHQLRASGVDMVATLNEQLTTLRQLQRRPSMEGTGAYTMQASAEPTHHRGPKVLIDKSTGQPAVLRFEP
jgi:hypothetical protein